MSWFDLPLLATGTLYVGTIVWLWVGLRRRPPPHSSRLPRVSVVVAARNEAERLGACLSSLRQQDYPGEWEVVVVDDRSTDGTAALLAAAAPAWSAGSALRVVQASNPPRYRCPKKSALTRGIEVAMGEVLLFTDADCRPPATWVSGTVALFTAEVGLVAGYSYPSAAPRFRQRLLALDNLAVGALSAGSMAMGRPLSCTGRNLAYRRAVYDQVNGFDRIGHLVGGDDVYFMRLVSRRTAWQMVYSRASAVPCEPPPTTWGRIVQQKVRHAAKAGNYGGPALALAAGVYLFHLFLAVGLIGAVAGALGWPVVAGVWAGRWLVDLLLLRTMALPGEHRLLIALPVLELCYIPYVLVFTVVGKLGWFRWR